MAAWCGLLLFSCIRSSTTDLQMCVNVYVRPTAGAGNARLDTWSSIVTNRFMLKGLQKHGCPEPSASKTLVGKSSLIWIHQEVMWIHSLCSLYSWWFDNLEVKADCWRSPWMCGLAEMGLKWTVTTSFIKHPRNKKLLLNLYVLLKANYGPFTPPRPVGNGFVFPVLFLKSDTLIRKHFVNELHLHRSVQNTGNAVPSIPGHWEALCFVWCSNIHTSAQTLSTWGTREHYICEHIQDDVYTVLKSELLAAPTILLLC